MSFSTKLFCGLNFSCGCGQFFGVALVLPTLWRSLERSSIPGCGNDGALVRKLERCLLCMMNETTIPSHGRPAHADAVSGATVLVLAARCTVEHTQGHSVILWWVITKASIRANQARAVLKKKKKKRKPPGWMLYRCPRLLSNAVDVRNALSARVPFLKIILVLFLCCVFPLVMFPADEIRLE